MIRQEASPNQTFTGRMGLMEHLPRRRGRPRVSNAVRRWIVTSPDHYDWVARRPRPAASGSDATRRGSLARCSSIRALTAACTPCRADDFGDPRTGVVEQGKQQVVPFEDQLDPGCPSTATISSRVRKPSMGRSKRFVGTVNARSTSCSEAHAASRAVRRARRADRRRRGHREAAYDLAGKCLYDAVMQGQLSMALEWVELLPEAELDRRPRLRLAAAWVLSLGERHAEAERLVERILAIFEPWAEAPPVHESRLLQVHANRLSALAILRGEPALARRYQQQAPRAEQDGAVAYAARWGVFVTGLSFLWEGQLRLAEDVLRPALAATEESLGRRHPLACMFAALLSSVTYESDRLDEATALLANRLDVVERTEAPLRRPCSPTARPLASPARKAPNTAPSTSSKPSSRAAPPATCRACAWSASPSRSACTPAASARKPAAYSPSASTKSWQETRAPTARCGSG